MQGRNPSPARGAALGKSVVCQHPAIESERFPGGLFPTEPRRLPPSGLLPTARGAPGRPPGPAWPGKPIPRCRGRCKPPPRRRPPAGWRGRCKSPGFPGSAPPARAGRNPRASSGKPAPAPTRRAAANRRRARSRAVPPGPPLRGRARLRALSASLFQPPPPAIRKGSGRGLRGQ